MSRIIFAVVLLVAPVACAQVDNLDLIMTPAPSVDPVAAAQGLYLPGETVHITVSIAMTDAPAPDVAIVQVNYFATPAVIDVNSDSIVPGFPLTLIYNEGYYFAAAAADAPSPLTVPEAPGAIDFFTFNAFAPTLPGQTHVASILGSFAIDQLAFAWTSDLSTIWRNGDEDMQHDIVGGIVTLTAIPEPAALPALALLIGLCARRRRCAPGNALAACLALFAGLLVALTAGPEARAEEIVGSNPPQSNPWCAEGQDCGPFRDVLQPGAGAVVTQGIGGTATPALGGISYSPVAVTFDSAPTPVPDPVNVTVTCDVMGCAASAADCPAVIGVEAQAPATFVVSLSGPIPPGARTTFSFAGTAATLSYEFVPGDVDFSEVVDSDDLIALQEALADGSAELNENLPRYDINRSGSVDAADFVRLHELLAVFGSSETGQPTDGAPASGDQPSAPGADVALPVPHGVRAVWQADDLHWCRDQSPRNKVDDLIDASSQPTFDVVANFRTAVTEADTAFLQALSLSDAPVRKLKYLPSVCVQNVPSAAIAQIAAMDSIAFVEGQWGFASDLEISIPTPANIQVTITPPLPPQSGASQTVHIAALIGQQKLGGVSIQATVP